MLNIVYIFKKGRKARINNNYQQEFSTALKEVHKIAKIRFDTLII